MNALLAKHLRAMMRAHAMTARAEISPRNFDLDSWREYRFTEACERAVFYFGLAVDYRKQAEKFEAAAKGGAS